MVSTESARWAFALPGCAYLWNSRRCKNGQGARKQQGGGSLGFFFFFFFALLFGAEPVAGGASQARDQIGAVAAG